MKRKRFKRGRISPNSYQIFDQPIIYYIFKLQNIILKGFISTTNVLNLELLFSSSIVELQRSLAFPIGRTSLCLPFAFAFAFAFTCMDIGMNENHYRWVFQRKITWIAATF